MTRRFIQEIRPEDRKPDWYYLCCSVPNDTLPFHTPADAYYGPLAGVQLTYFELRDTESGDPVARYSAEDGWWFIIVENAREEDGEGLAGPYSDILIELYQAPLPDTTALQELAVALGLESEDLDEAVHDAASHIGSNVNNQGLDRQIQFLVDQLGEQGAEEEIRTAAEGHRDEDEEGYDDEDWDGCPPPAPPTGSSSMAAAPTSIGKVVDEALGLAGALQVIGLIHTRADVQALIAYVEQMAACIAQLNPGCAAVYRAYLAALRSNTLPAPDEPPAG